MRTQRNRQDYYFTDTKVRDDLQYKCFGTVELNKVMIIKTLYFYQHRYNELLTPYYEKSANVSLFTIIVNLSVLNVNEIYILK